MNKNILILLFFTVIFNTLQSQEIGVKMGSSFIRNNKILNMPINVGVYYCDNIHNKIDFSISYLYSKKKKENIDIGVQTDFTAHNIVIDFLYKVNIKNSSNLILGLGSGVALYNVINQGINTNWIYTSNFINVLTRFVVGFEYKNIFNSPISIQIFTVPSYVINVHQETDTYTLTNTNNNLQLLNVNLGLKYTF